MIASDERTPAPTVRGWCPGGRRPMMSGDGLVVRVRPRLGSISPSQTIGLAALSERYGNTRIDLTNRANLQIRGVEERHLEALQDGLHGLDLLDEDAAHEARRNIILQPFHGNGPWNEPALAAGLAAGLESPDFARLPGKFGFVVDAGQRRHLTGARGDVRIEASSEGLLVRPDGAASGPRAATESEAVALALSFAAWFIASGGIGADGRGRMADHVSRKLRPATLSGEAVPYPKADPATPGLGPDGTLVAAAFGQLSPDALRVLAEACDAEIRLTPFRMVYLPGVRCASAPHPDLIVSPDDPVLRVAACTGAPRCHQAHAETRPLARALAAKVPEPGVLHVSGCAKGCAHPAPADWTLVAREGRFDLVTDGAPWDQPCRTGLGPDELATLLEA